MDKFEYTPEAMIDLIVANPTWSHRKYASYFGYPPSWFANVLASDEFQLKLDPRRSEIKNPAITATLRERFTSLTVQSLACLQVRMDSDDIHESTVVKAIEVGVKALGMGSEGAMQVKQHGGLESLADRLTGLLDSKQQLGVVPKKDGTVVYEVKDEQAIEVETKEVDAT